MIINRHVYKKLILISNDLKKLIMMLNIFKYNNCKISNCDSYTVNIKSDFTYENIIKRIEKLNIDEKYLSTIIAYLQRICFVDNTKDSLITINYISWINQEGKEILKIINDHHKAINNHYYKIVI